LSESSPRCAPLSGKPATRGDLGLRAESLPRELKRLLDSGAPAFPGSFENVSRFDVTGIGASEGPARLLVATLLELGRLARFVPIARFVTHQDATDAGLIVFSQGLCPNARLALRQVNRYAAALLFTAVTGEEKDGPLQGSLLHAFQEAGGVVWSHPPDREDGSLVRLVGPACALLAALRACRTLRGARAEPDWFAKLDEVPLAVLGSFSEARQPLHADPAAFLGTGGVVEFLPSLAWKWQEALFAPLPHAFDVLSFMHGPLQSRHGRPSTLVLCTNRPTPGELDLCDRLRRVVGTEPHRLVELSSSLPGPLGWFELDAATNRLVLLEIEARHLDPGHWPAQGHDAPLYQVGE
jgi:hypothetical protein